MITFCIAQLVLKRCDSQLRVERCFIETSDQLKPEDPTGAATRDNSRKIDTLSSTCKSQPTNKVETNGRVLYLGRQRKNGNFSASSIFSLFYGIGPLLSLLSFFPENL
jgi:hypothetical protein